LPDLSHQIDNIVFPLDEALEGPASNIASFLRKKGRAVDLVEDKRLKWYAVFFSFFGRKWYAF
jgi:histidyl-tRNA synthetase